MKKLEGLEGFVTYFTIAVVGIAILLAALVYFLRREKLKDYGKSLTVFAAGYAFAVSGVMLYTELAKMAAKDRIYAYVFYPILAAILAVGLIVVTGYALYLLHPKGLKVFKYVAIGICTAAAIMLIVVLSVYYAREIIPQGYYVNVSQLGLVLGAVVLAVLIAAVALVFGKKKESDSRSIAYASVCIALSFALSYMRLFKLPQGGSVTLASLLPLMLYSYKFGVRKGVTAGAIYGILQAIQDPYIIHPVQFLLDYPVAFAGIGIAGIFNEREVFKKPVLNFMLGAVVAVAFRYAAHVLSGIFAFAIYGIEAGYSPVAWGFLYNSFTLADMAISMAVGGLMFASKSFVKTLDGTTR